MKLTTTATNILSIVSDLRRIVLREKTISSMAMLLIQPLDKKTCTFTATDGNSHLKCFSDKISFEGSDPILVSAQKLYDACAKCVSDSVVVIEGDEKEVSLFIHLDSGKRVYKLKTVPSKDFPKQEKIDKPSSFQIKACDLRYLFEKVHFAMAQDNVQYRLNGVFLEMGDGRIAAVATDGHRLAKCELPFPQGDKEKQCILPRKAVQELLHELDDDTEEATFNLTSRYIQIVYKEREFTAQQIDATYPSYREVIPKKFTSTFALKREPLREAIESACVISEMSIFRVELMFKKNLLQINAKNDLNEQVNIEQKINYEGAEVRIRFNAQYLLDILTNADSEEIVLSIMDSNTAAQITEKGNKATQHIVMPVRI